MTMSASGPALHSRSDRAEIKRWSLSAGGVVAVHALVLAFALVWYAANPDIAGTGMQPMMIDLESAPPAEPPKTEVAPGPEMQESPAPQPEPEPEKKVTVEDQIAPTPLQDKPVVIAPPEKKEPPKPVKDKPKPLAQKPPVTSDAAAPRTTAPQRTSQAARANYNGMLAAHLQRYKQYPPAARAAGNQGVVMLNITVNRSGRVLSSSIARSSGSAALDAETMAMIRRAQPLPPFPPEIMENSLSFSVPLRYSLQ